MSCSINRWGTGTCKERPSNTAASREMEQRLKEIQAARANQDSIYFPSTSAASSAARSTAAASSGPKPLVSTFATPRHDTGASAPQAVALPQLHASMNVGLWDINFDTLRGK